MLEESPVKDELSKKEVGLYIVEGFMVSPAYTNKVKYSQIAVGRITSQGRAEEVDLYIVESFMLSAAHTEEVKYSQIAVGRITSQG
ncbi:hypothetical protein Pmani_001851 [Petrolisthes manimaculis]|uniref:Uncharacterized protein n=1 Tax=Petrolisthes manimaculis TaxID=1843537 RepID=A0AAE1QJV1_9EUCA|nr:hypothetical protein Pmani_001851 [Petrolisthes manimaculis]